MTRIYKIQEIEEEDNYVAEVLLDNSDYALNDIDFEQYQGIVSFGYQTGVARTAWVANTPYVADDIRVPTTANGYQYRCTVAGTSHATTEPTWGTALGVTQTDGTVTWEMDGNTGDEYSPVTPMKVVAQEFFSSETQLTCRLYLIGIPNQMRQDLAESEYTQLATDVNTVKTLITAIAMKTLAPYTNYVAITPTYDSEDSLIDVFIPADFFRVDINANRDDKIQELLDYTGCKRRAEDDGELHIFDPVTTGTTYDYEYRLAVDTYHTFFSKALRQRFVNPNKEIVKSPASHSPAYSGSATSATSYALAPKIHTTERRLVSNAQGDSIAAAMIERNELNAEKGSIVVPMNCGQEIFDYIKVTDSRENGDSRVGNVQYIQRNCALAIGNSKGQFDMTIRFGRINEQSIAVNLADRVVRAPGEPGLPAWLQSYLNEIYSDITFLYQRVNALIGFANRVNDGLGTLDLWVKVLTAWVNDHERRIIALEAGTGTKNIISANTGYPSHVNTSAVYATAHDAVNGTGAYNGLQPYIGQDKGVTNYTIYRGALEFDLSAEGGTLTGVDIYLKSVDRGLDTGMTVTVVSGADLANPLVVADYGDLLNDTTSWGTLACTLASFPLDTWYKISLNATGIAAVQTGLGGTFRFGLRSNRDIASTVPTNQEFVSFYGQDSAAALRPKIVLTYAS